ncbi:MAG: TRAM domain-containing protein [Nitrososphaeraceae archaeon]
MKRPRRYEKDEKKGNHFGGSKAPRAPISVGEEYIVTIEEIGKEGTGVAKIRGVSILVNNTNPGDKAMIRITKVGRTYVLAEVFNQKLRSRSIPVSGAYT